MNGWLVILGDEESAHPVAACCHCGASARDEPCHPATLPGTRIAAVVCDDAAGCELRQEAIFADRFDDGLSWDEWFRSLPLSPLGPDEGRPV